ncbi:MAG: DoxX family protein [Bacteroidetes bacterium]|nr:DoxX family protein [Bacteroidota bacterium]
MSTYQIIGILYAIVGVITVGALVYERSKHKTFDLNYLPITGTLILVTRLLVGALFIYSGFVKANDYIGFAYKLEEYFTIFGDRWPAFEGFFSLFVPLAEPMAWFIAVFEVALAIALILGWKMNLTAWLTMIMMVFFTILTGYSHFTGSVTDCGCFGDALKIEPWESFVKDIILTFMLIPLFLVRKSIYAFPNSKIAGIITAAVFVITGIFSWYCHENLPMSDFRAYKVGKDLKICTTEMTVDGYPKCKDWFFVDEENYLIDRYTLLPEDDSTRIKSGKAYQIEPVNPFSGVTLMIVTYNVTKASPEAMKASGDLGRALAGSGVNVLGATSTGPSSMEETYIPEYQLDYPFTFMDETVLKTIVRSHPGYVLLKEGVILKKWHQNNIPSAEEVKSLAGI